MNFKKLEEFEIDTKKAKSSLSSFYFILDDAPHLHIKCSRRTKSVKFLLTPKSRKSFFFLKKFVKKKSVYRVLQDRHRSFEFLAKKVGRKIIGTSGREDNNPKIREFARRADFKSRICSFLPFLGLCSRRWLYPLICSSWYYLKMVQAADSFLMGA
jgi:IS1 family transposase